MEASFENPTHARYDGHAEWYESAFAIGEARAAANRLIEALLGLGSGLCLDVYCGTGLNAGAIRATGRTWLGFDVSTDMLAIARRQGTGVCRANACHLPVTASCCDAAVATYMHTDVDDFGMVVREISRTLRPGATFVYIGNHPCFVGTFVRRNHEKEVGHLVLTPGYAQADWHRHHRPGGLGERVGRRHVPLSEFLHAFIDAGFALDTFQEFGGIIVPWDIAIRVRKAA